MPPTGRAHADYAAAHECGVVADGHNVLVALYHNRLGVVAAILAVGVHDAAPHLDAVEAWVSNAADQEGALRGCAAQCAGRLVGLSGSPDTAGAPLLQRVAACRAGVAVGGRYKLHQWKEWL